MAAEDIKQVFYDDIRTKKEIGRSGYHKKNGSRSKKVPCSTDYMSQRKWEKMNGDVKTYDLNASMSWQDFCDMADDLKDQYIRSLASRFGATKQALCEVFGTNIRSFDKQTMGCNFSDIFTLGRRITSQGKHDLQAFFEMEPQREVTPVQEQERFAISQFSMDFAGSFDPEKITNLLYQFLHDGQAVSIHICCDILGGKHE